MKATSYIILFCTLVLSVNTIQAQNKYHRVTGVIADTSSTPLPFTTVVLNNTSDSTLYKFGITNDNGVYELDKVENGNYYLQVSYMGYNSITKPLKVTESSAGTINIKTIVLDAKNMMLSEFEVTANIAIVFKEDTIEYNAASFQTKEHDNVEELLKKLPGVEIDRDGKVKAQGKEVQKILVNGKEFFGDDPKIATKNLPANAIKKVQVFDKQSEDAEFTGVDDGERTKTINLELKEDKNNGYFGNLMAGYGTGNRYSGKANINRFSKNSQLSAIGLANNLNEDGFSFREYMSFLNGGSGGGYNNYQNASETGVPLSKGTAQGFTATQAGGLNFNQELSKNSELTASYFYSGLKSEINQTRFRENYTGENNYNSIDTSSSTSKTQGHKISLRSKHKITENQQLSFNTNIGLSSNIAKFSGTNENHGTENSLQSFSNTSRNSSVEKMDYAFGGNYRKKFKKKGRSITLRGNYNNAEDTRVSQLDYRNSFFTSSISNFATDMVEQVQNDFSDSYNYSGQLTYSEPLGKKSHLMLFHKYYYSHSENNKEFYDISMNSGEEKFNPTLSNFFNNDFYYHEPGIGLRAKPKGNSGYVHFGTKAHFSTLQGNNSTLGSQIKKNFTNLLPYFSAGSFNHSKTFHGSYSTNVDEPSIKQLQPVVDNSDPLRIYMGNPDLKVAYAHNLYANMTLHNSFNFSTFYTFLMASYRHNKITNSVIINDDFSQTLQPINIPDDYLVNGEVGYEAPFRPLKIKYKVSTGGNYNNTVLFVNSIRNTSNIYNARLNGSLSNRNQDRIVVTIGTKYSYNYTSYSENSALNNSYTTIDYYAAADIDFTESWTLSSSFHYNIYSGEAFNGFTAVPLLRAEISRTFLKGEKGKLALLVADILNRNTGIERTSTLNYVEESQTQTIGRYALLSFYYSFTKGEKPKPNHRGH